MTFTLDQILELVGPLDDMPGENTARERFRKFLNESVKAPGAVRDYVEACTKNKGSQYDYALQDLVNHTGALIGFEVVFGRYKGVTNDIGHDGLWRWNDFTIVIEVKTTDAFSIQTSVVTGYVDRLISRGDIPDWDHAMGLYVFGRTDSQLKQLSNSIVAEKRTGQLRIATVDDVLSLAELVQEEQITADEAVSLLKPGGVFIGDTVRLLSRIAAQATGEIVDDTVASQSAAAENQTPIRAQPTSSIQASPAIFESSHDPYRATQLASTGRMYLITPVSDEADATARETITSLLEAGWYVFGDRTSGRKQLKPGDQICFYASGVGVVAEAEVASSPERHPPGKSGIGKDLKRYPWSFRLTKPRFFFEEPIVIDAELRSQLDAFDSRDPSQSWSWFVQGTRIVTAHDFNILTGKNDPD